MGNELNEAQTTAIIKIYVMEVKVVKYSVDKCPV